MNNYKIILASGSPRRKELLELMGIKDYEIIVSNIEENVDKNLTIEKQVEELAYKKAKSVYDKTTGNRIIIGSDTIVEKDNKIYGKPKDEKDAFNMLKNFSGSSLNVITSIAVLVNENGSFISKVDYDITKVYINKLSDEEISDWINTGEALDKAGAFAIQSKFAIHIEKIDGNYTTVIGLPVHKLYDILKDFI